MNSVQSGTQTVGSKPRQKHEERPSSEPCRRPLGGRLTSEQCSAGRRPLLVATAPACLTAGRGRPRCRRSGAGRPGASLGGGSEWDGLGRAATDTHSPCLLDSSFHARQRRDGLASAGRTRHELLWRLGWLITSETVQIASSREETGMIAQTTGWQNNTDNH